MRSLSNCKTNKIDGFRFFIRAEFANSYASTSINEGQIHLSRSLTSRVCAYTFLYSGGNSLGHPEVSSAA